MNLQKKELLSYLQSCEAEVFSICGRTDERRFLARKFPSELPVRLCLQAYPAYKLMVGENWMHWHDYYELWIATEGAGEYRSGNHQFPFGPGDIVLVDPLKIHGVMRMDRAHRPLVIFFRAEAIASSGIDFLAAWDCRPERLAPRLEANAVAARPVHAALLRLARAWFEEQNPSSRAIGLKFHLLETLFHLRAAFLSEDQIAGETISMRADREVKLSRVLEFVAENAHRSVSQPEVARIAGMSTSRFRVFFKETTGWGFGDYLRDFRLERAARFLRESELSLATIAYQTGFADQSHLQRLFKSKFGISPLAFRRRHQSELSAGSPVNQRAITGREPAGHA